MYSWATRHWLCGARARLLWTALPFFLWTDHCLGFSLLSRTSSGRGSGRSGTGWTIRLHKHRKSFGECGDKHLLRSHQPIGKHLRSHCFWKSGYIQKGNSCCNWRRATRSSYCFWKSSKGKGSETCFCGRRKSFGENWKHAKRNICLPHTLVGRGSRQFERCLSISKRTHHFLRFSSTSPRNARTYYAWKR